MYAISTLLFLVAGKASRVPKVTYYFSSIVEYKLLKLSTMCKSPLHGPRNYVDRTCERSADYSARTFSCFHAKPKCNFSSSSVRWIHNVRAIVADCMSLFLGEKETKYGWGIRQNVNMVGTVF